MPRLGNLWAIVRSNSSGLFVARFFMKPVDVIVGFRAGNGGVSANMLPFSDAAGRPTAHLIVTSLLWRPM